MADSTLQFKVLVNVATEIEDQFRHDPDVAVHSDLLWYPERGHPRVSRAPDVMVIFGRPKAMREPYRQWNEGNIAPQVAIEVRSHSNTEQNLAGTLAFYDRYGVEEYYLYDPRVETIEGWQRVGKHLEPIGNLDGWESPRLHIRIALEDGRVQFYHPDGTPFGDVLETKEAAREAQAQAEREGRRAIREQIRAEQAEAAAEEERHRAEQERRRAEAAERRAEVEHRRSADAIEAAEEERRRAEAAARAQAATEAEAAEMRAEMARLLERLRLAGGTA